ncbi:MAG: hypothetical protein E7277_07175 [Lachnospiraceae bacterium]|jgi:hypothetical protein|nr:hypothetical protein [Lachnospiraceae bacterium]
MRKSKQMLAFLMAAVMMITVWSVPMPVEAATRVLTIKTAAVSNARKIHEALNSQKPLVLRIAGNKAFSKKTLSKLEKEVRKINQQDVYFHYRAYRQKGNYYLYEISKDFAKQYYYATMFCRKLFRYFKTGKCYGYIWTDGYGEKNGYTQYRYVYEAYQAYKTANSDMPFSDYVMKDMDSFYGLDADVAKSYEVAFAADSFGELSDAMKVWVVAESGYFACMFDRNNPYGDFPKFCMIYSRNMKHAQYNGSGMRAMVNNKVQGVCANYAVMESLLWSQWGLHNQINTSWKINHAWSVVKVKNAKGKTLWIPFDYRVGPSGIYKASESKQYQLYLKGVKGAPNYKNFQYADFN